MESEERENACYEPAGVPITPQARQLGYEFSVYVSDRVWRDACMYKGASKHRTSLDKRIFELLASCYTGMLKRLTQTDDFVFYKFKHFYWPVNATAVARKKCKRQFGARLFLDSQELPWLYIFDLDWDSIENLKKAELQE